MVDHRAAKMYANDCKADSYEVPAEVQNLAAAYLELQGQLEAERGEREQLIADFDLLATDAESLCKERERATADESLLLEAELAGMEKAKLICDAEAARQQTIGWRDGAGHPHVAKLCSDAISAEIDRRKTKGQATATSSHASA